MFFSTACQRSPRKYPSPRKVATHRHRAAVSEQGELGRLHIAHAGGVGGEMADAGNEVAERQPPVAHAREPGVGLV